jgi:PadR family transcriptional regulator, regulatory protein PadR
MQSLLRAGRLPSKVTTMTIVDRKLLTREILLGFWKVHILHHAAESPVVGQWILTELRHHGYDISPGTLYPLLKRMERNGWLRCEVEDGAGPRGRRYYHLTKDGAAVLDFVRENVAELHHEVIEEAAHRARHPAKRRTRTSSSSRQSAPAPARRRL